VKQPDLLYEFVSKGTLTQLTAASLVGVFGKKIMQFSEQLIEFNLVHFIASDSHSLPNRDFYLSEAFECLEEVFGKEYTEMYKGNAELLIKNQLIPTLSPDPIRRKKIFGVF
jgi:protein-tyrosine phosphatase